jgi:hypothetical protein
MAAPWLEEIVDSLTQSGFEQVLDGFVSQHAAAFLSGGEATSEQTQLHEQYVRMYDSRIDAYLKKHNLTRVEFEAALRSADAAAGEITRREDRSFASSLAKVHDFANFRSMMLQRAIEQGQTPR